MQMNKGFQEEKVLMLNEKLDAIVEKAKTMETALESELIKVHPVYKKSAYNLLHYLALRTFDIDKIDEELRAIGLMGLSSVEAHVMDSILNLKQIINRLLGTESLPKLKNAVSREKSHKLMRKNNKLLFGLSLKRSLYKDNGYFT
jgi:pyruvate kinase